MKCIFGGMEESSTSIVFGLSFLLPTLPYQQAQQMMLCTADATIHEECAEHQKVSRNLEVQDKAVLLAYKGVVKSRNNISVNMQGRI